MQEGKVCKDLIESALPLYKSCLRKLKEVMKAEAEEKERLALQAELEAQERVENVSLNESMIQRF